MNISPWTLELPAIVTYSSPRIWQDNKHIASIHYCENTKDCEANARLIASAPDMLNALNVALMCMIGYTHRNEVIDNAIKTVDEAIKKATNE
jgi:hypothetical protein